MEHPAARVLVQLSEMQDKEVGDGTTSVVRRASPTHARTQAQAQAHTLFPTATPTATPPPPPPPAQVILASELLKRAHELVKNGIHPTSVMAGY